MSVELFTYFLIILSLVGEYFLIYFTLQNYKKFKLVKNTPTSAIGDLGRGFREIKGKVRISGHTLKSPFFKKDCVFYEMTIDQRQERSGGGASGGRKFQDKKSVCFEVEDSSGMVEVDLEGAEVLLDLKAKGIYDSHRGPNKDLKEVFGQYGFYLKGIIFETPIKYQETILKENDEVYLLGPVELNEDSKPIFRKNRDLPFILTGKKENHLIRHYRLEAINYLGAAILFFIFIFFIPAIVKFFRG